MKQDDPSPTYRGYRRQALYALSRLFDATLRDDGAIQPEGSEDLAIYGQDGQLIEVVQVKDLSANLSASSFKPFFYERIAGLCQPNSSVRVRVASYGTIGPDLLAAKRGDESAKKRVAKTISKDQEFEQKDVDGKTKTVVKPGLPADKANEIIEHIEFEHVDEEDLTRRIHDTLKSSVVGVNSSDAFQFLMWWMLTSAESRPQITRAEAVKNLTAIGKFLEGRRSFHDEWFRSIIPLDDEPSELSSDTARDLADQFFQGGRVLFQHITANIDIRREIPLARIHQGFNGSNVVVVHAASGQGKTTVAFRYVKECAPASLRFRVEPAEGLKHARQMAFAIRQYASAVAMPALLHIDVRPGNGHWVELVRELATEKSIRMLITIREEDWQRAGISTSDFRYSEVAMDFDEVDARSIHSSLKLAGLAKSHIDFEEAWSQFGERKSLLEFVYFVTQAETLTERISQQVEAFQEEVRRGSADRNEELLLRIVAVASSFEARLDLVRTIEYCKIASPSATLRRLENEYFVRKSAGGRRLDGFHAIRSEVLVDCLTDPALAPWDQIAGNAIPVMVEEDLEAFLLYAFSRRAESTRAIIETLRGWETRTWRGTCGVLRALLWLGLREYWKENRAVADDARSENAGGWGLLLEWDMAGILIGEGSNLFERLGETGAYAAERCRFFRSKLSDRSRVFRFAREWLVSFHSKPELPADQGDFLAVAEVLFWTGYLQLESSLKSALNHEALTSAARTLPVHLIGEFLLGVRTSLPDLVTDWMESHRETFFTHIRREAAIVSLEEDDERVVAHFLLELDVSKSRLDQEPSRIAQGDASLHDVTIERVRLLSQLVAGKTQYGAIGYGYRNLFFESDFDDANKSGVLARSLLPRWATQFNLLSRGHSEHRLRPVDWNEYFSSLNRIREQCLRCLADLTSSLTEWQKQQRGPISLAGASNWEMCLHSLNAGLPFPRSAVDEWGFVYEADAIAANSLGLDVRYNSRTRLSELRAAVGEYVRDITNFLNQVPRAMALAAALRYANEPKERDRILRRAEESACTFQNMRLSVINGFSVCKSIKQLHLAFDQSESLRDFRDEQLESREANEYIAAMDRWLAFTFPQSDRRPTKKGASVPLRWVVQPIQNRLRNELMALRRNKVVAKLRPDIVEWGGKSGLWIVVNSYHLFHAAAALPLVWQAIRRSFPADTSNPSKYCVSTLLWDEIIVALTVDGRSVDGQAHRNFRSAAFREDETLDRAGWALTPEIVPAEVLNRAGIELWNCRDAMRPIEELTSSYALLLNHVRHIADFARVPDADEIGTSILQSHLDGEAGRIYPLLQAVLNSFTRIFDLALADEDLSNKPNFRAAVDFLIALKDVVSPWGDAELVTEGLAIRQFCEWGIRLSKGMEFLFLARLFWIAEAIGCPEIDDLA